jgi:precorrin-6B methylase 2
MLAAVRDARDAAVHSMLSTGYLVDIGWFNALERKIPVGPNDEPLPWITYPAIEFLEIRLRKTLDVFEFGAGNSTLYYASRVRSVTSVEHDSDWHKIIGEAIPSNVTLMFRELVYGGEYAKSVLGAGRCYDIIVIDGRDRVNCVKNAVQMLKQGGVIILDDSQRPNYSSAKEHLCKLGFRNIEFWGISPGYVNRMCTTIFYRGDNVLGI